MAGVACSALSATSTKNTGVESRLSGTAVFVLFGIMGKGTDLLPFPESKTSEKITHAMRWRLKPDAFVFDGALESLVIRSSSKLEIKIPLVFYAEANPQCADPGGNSNGWKRSISGTDLWHVTLTSSDGVVQLEWLSVTDSGRWSGVRTSLIGLSVGCF